MQYRTLGQTEEHVSALGFGCMRLPVLDGRNDRIDEAEAVRMVRYGIDQGINYLDTAYVYHGGNSERLLGKALVDGYREKVFLATKLPTWQVNSREQMDEILDEQLERLQTDHIDFYLLHCLDASNWSKMEELEAADFLEKAHSQGKIRHVGFSFHDDLKVFKEIVDARPWDFCQIQYNYLDVTNQAGTEGLEYAASKGLGVVIMEPLRGGKLAGPVPEDVRKAWERAERPRAPVAWALDYLWDRPDVGVVLSGMSTMEQVEENVRLADEADVGMLNDDERGLIAGVRRIYEGYVRADCTNCRYCMPCDHGVNIPGILGLLNQAAIFDDVESTRREYASQIPADARASNCVVCGDCVEVCPQNLDIPHLLGEACSVLES